MSREVRLRLRTARLFWAMGSAVVLRVPLGAYVGGGSGKRSKGRAPGKDLAELDVLGLEVGRDFRVRRRAAACRGGRAGTTELFWLRGAAEFFGAEDASLVVQYDETRTPAMRDIATRLKLSLMTFNDLDALEGIYGSDAVANFLFDDEVVARVETLLRPEDKGLERLADYALRSSWQLPQHRNLQAAIGYLRGASDVLHAEEQGHLMLFGEVVLRYAVSLYALCAAVVARGYPHAREVTLTYLHGGELGLVDARQRMRAVQALQRQLEGGTRGDLTSAFSDTPPHLDAMLDVVERLLRRPDLGTEALRQLTVALRGVIAGERPSWQLLDASEPLAGKLVVDIASFLTRVAGLDRGLRERLSWALETEREAVESREPREAVVAEPASTAGPPGEELAPGPGDAPSREASWPRGDHAAALSDTGALNESPRPGASETQASELAGGRCNPALAAGRAESVSAPGPPQRAATATDAMQPAPTVRTKKTKKNKAPQDDAQLRIAEGDAQQ